MQSCFLLYSLNCSFINLIGTNILFRNLVSIVMGENSQKNGPQYSQLQVNGKSLIYEFMYFACIIKKFN